MRSTGMLKTPRRRDACALRAGRRRPGRKGTVCLFQGRAEFIEKYFETVRDLRARGFAVATFDWRGQGLSERALADRRKGHVARLLRIRPSTSRRSCSEVVLPDCPPPIFALGHSMGGAVLMRACPRGQPLVRSHGAVGADDRAAGTAQLAAWRGAARALMRHHRAWLGLCAGRQRRRSIGDAAFVGNIADLRSGALRAQRRGAGGSARARHRLADGRVGRRRASRDERIRRARLRRQDPPADPDRSRPAATRWCRRRRSRSSPCSCAPARI